MRGSGAVPVLRTKATHEYEPTTVRRLHPGGVRGHRIERGHHFGGAGFITRAEDDAAWANISTFEGATNLVADRLDANRDIFDDKSVSVETCERLMGASIAELIAAGRAKLAGEQARA